MATLNDQTNYDDNEDGSPLSSPKSLDWNPLTWTSNIRRAAIVSISGALILTLLILFLQNQEQELKQKLSASNSNKQQAQTQLRESDQERDTIVKYLPLLHELTERGIYGEEKRLEWVEQLRIIEKHWPGVSIRYGITPQKLIPKEDGNGTASPIPPGAKLPNGEPVKAFGIFTTEMKLTLDILHEGDVFAILTELHSAKLGLFRVKSCTLNRPNEGKTLAESGGPVSAVCILEWISMTTYATP